MKSLRPLYLSCLLALAGCGGGGEDDSTIEAKRAAQMARGSTAIESQARTDSARFAYLASTSNAVSNSTFESGATNWELSADVLTLNPSMAHGGSYYAWLGGYNNASDTASQNVSVPASASQAYLQFWYRITTNETAGTTAYDFMRVYVKNPTTGSTIATLKTYSNLTTTSGWTQSEQIDLSAYKGQTIKLQFAATTDASQSTSFSIDDVSVMIGDSTTSPSPSSYNTVVQQLYIAYFGRPADPSGLTNFAAALAAANAPTTIQGLTAAYGTTPAIKVLVDAFGTSAESNALYTGNTASFVYAIYQNVLNRAPDAAGQQWWADAIDSGNLTRGNAALSIMSGALSNTSAQGQIDAQVVSNKVAVGTSFTQSLSTDTQIASYSGDSAAATVRSMLASVTNTTNVTTFQTTIVNTITTLVASAPATSFRLTTGTAGSGQGTLSPASGTYTPGQIVTISAEPHFFSDFISWTSSSTGCAGGTGGCRLTMDRDQYMQARFEPGIFTSDFNAQYQVFYGSSCVWNVTWSNTRIELKFVSSNGSYVGKLRVVGQRTSQGTTSGCNGSSSSLDTTFDVPSTTSSFSSRVKIFNGLGDEYLTIATIGSLPGPNIGNVGGFVPVQMGIEYSGTDRRGGTSMITSLTRSVQ